MNSSGLVMVLGGGEIGSAISTYLWKAGIKTCIVLDSQLINLRRPICFSDALHIEKKHIKGAEGLLISGDDIEKHGDVSIEEKWKKAINFHIHNRTIPIFTQEEYPNFLIHLNPEIVINTIESSQPTLDIECTGYVIGLYPFNIPGKDCHLSVESRMNYWLGEVYTTPPENRENFDIKFFKRSLVTISAPIEGVFISLKEIGEKIRQNESVGTINQVDIKSPYTGQIWGLFYSGRFIAAKQPMVLICEGYRGKEYTDFDFSHRVIAGSILAEVENYFNK
jgi:hypothetical protein